MMVEVLNSFGITRYFKSAWTSKRHIQAVVFGVVLIVGFTLLISLGPQSQQALGTSTECQFPAIYNFGDSNSDTGCASAAFGRFPYPNGISFFGEPSGRVCDGRLMIDFIAENLGLPYLSGYLNSIEANFQRGADFAASGASIQLFEGKLCESGLSPLSLDVQLLQFEDLKERTEELYNQAKSLNIASRLPRPEDFPKALYTLDIGQNDLHNALTTTNEDEAQKIVPKLIDLLALAIKKLHQQGARTFWIHNTGPIGCLPYLLINYPPQPGNFDEIGCLKSYNEVAKEFNRQLKSRISQLRIQLPDALLVYVDIYSAKYSVIADATKNGFVDPLGYCCNHSGNPNLHSWNKDTVNGTAVYGAPCSDPSKYISWDSIHYTEAANRWVVNRIFDGSHSDPPLPITNLCKRP